MKSRETKIAALSLLAIAMHLALRYAAGVRDSMADAPLLAAIVLGGLPLVVALGRQLIRREFGSDLLAGIAILSASFLGEYLVAVVVVLMLSGGQALEAYATARASSALDALARRNPTVAHRVQSGIVTDTPLGDVHVGDVLVVLPSEICPVDGIVRAGSSTMDEAYLSGEPFLISKTVGAEVISGAVNGDGALTIAASRVAADSRYARIMDVVRRAEQNRPGMRRLADRLGAWYTPLALVIAGASGLASGDTSRFLAVLVIATPCPLLLAIPVVIMGSISLAARRSIVIKDPAVLERLGSCRTAIFDKTGTLTLGRPALTAVIPAPGFAQNEVLRLASGLEQYSRHPLAAAVLEAGDRAGIPRAAADEISERPGTGMTGRVGGRLVRLTSRAFVPAELLAELPKSGPGLECLVLIDGAAAGLLQFRDVPRPESHQFVLHLGPSHLIDRTLLVSGDRESEVQYLADVVGIQHVYSGQSPEQKVAIVTRETKVRPTLFVGDGMNDAPAMLTATVGIALGHRSDVTAEAAGAVVLDGSLSRVDELLHIAHRTRRIALQSAVGGMLLSGAGMVLAAGGWLSPLMGAVAQEAIDVAAVLNALRAAFPPKTLSDFSSPTP
jgi:heavy metal translocating P-type ATPase